MEQYKEGGISIEVEKLDKKLLLSDEGNPTSEWFWIREKGLILYDPQKKYKVLFAEKNKVEDHVYGELTWHAFKQLFNSYEYKKSSTRNQKIVAIEFVNKILKALSLFLFVYHKQPVPTVKWRWAFIEKQDLYDIKQIDKPVSLSPQNTEKIFEQLVAIENYAKRLVLKQGYPKKKLKSHGNSDHKVFINTVVSVGGLSLPYSFYYK